MIGLLYVFIQAFIKGIRSGMKDHTPKDDNES